jgi:hypothetical protein
LKNRIFLSFFLILLSSKNINAQNIFENNQAEVYNYLSRISQKGFISFNDLIQPLSRKEINNKLKELSLKDSLLNKIEKEELYFYIKEYGIKILPTYDKLVIIKKDEKNRWRAFKSVNELFEINADPIIGYKKITGTDRNITQLSNGFNIWGSLGKNKNWGYSVYYRDYTENGTIQKNTRKESSEQNVVLIGTRNDNTINYSDIRAQINYGWKNGIISFGKDNLNWGYGENGKLVLSQKAPSYPLIRLDYNPASWIQFNYTHAWLNSNIIDSSLSYLTQSGRLPNDARINFIQKFLATHSIQVEPFKGLFLSIGESIIYSDKLDPGFLLPVNLFKFYDNNRSNYQIEAGSNGQYFFGFNSRNHIKNTQLYGTLFIDEIKVSAILDKKNSRNQLGFNLGFNKTDIIIPYLTVGGEYARINPFVYSNLIPAQTYKNYDTYLGDWMGNNFDRTLVYLKYTPIAKLKLYARLQKIRKGDLGTIFEQYETQPQPSFLNNYIKTRNDIFLQLRYEWINNLYFNASFESIENKFNNFTLKDYTIQTGISFGL